ncbi:MAG: nitrogenase component 1 [Johnsonella sp.]|nr:nitrogenase component 1 [Johnsonella sp.]
MSCFQYEESLEYTAPSHGDWGLVHILCLVPDLHVLFVCPPACGRHSALGAIGQNIKHKVSYYFLDAQEIARGYDEQIRSATKELLGRLRKRPKALSVVVSCLDDLIGTDVDKVMEELNAEIPDIHFRAGHMNPITMNTSTPPLVTNLAMMYSFLDHRREKKKTLNILVPFVPLRRSGEIFRFLEAMGIEEVHQLQEKQSFEDFQKMGESRWNLNLSPVLERAASEMRQKGIASVSAYTSFHPDSVEESYRKIYEFFEAQLGVKTMPDLSREKNAALEAIEEAKALIKDMPIRISQGSVSRPFHLAKSLSDMGFNVEAVVAQVLPPFEEPYMRALAERGCKFIQTQHFKTILFEHINREVLAIGYDGAYMAQTGHFLNLMMDEGCFGYEGIEFLMQKMMEAVKETQDLQTRIKEEGLVI